MINADGRLIGIVAIKFFKEENINFAIPVDRVRHYFSDLIAAEEKGDVWFGMKPDLLADRAVLAEVAANSPAAQAGLRAGDVLVTADGRPLRNGLDWPLQIIGAKPGQILKLGCERDGRPLAAVLTAVRYPVAEMPGSEGMTPGLKFQLFHTARLARLPDFTALTPQASGVAKTVDLTALGGIRAEDFAVVFDGYLRVPSAGVCRLITRSDDGCRLSLDGAVVLDNDGNHRPMDIGRWLGLGAGLHALKLEYFQATGGAEVRLFLETPDGKVSELGAGAYFHR